MHHPRISTNKNPPLSTQPPPNPPVPCAVLEGAVLERLERDVIIERVEDLESHADNWWTWMLGGSSGIGGCGW